MPTPESSSPIRTGHSYRVLRHRDFRLLWGCDGISTAGTQIQRTAVAWQVFKLTGDPFHLGLLGLARFVPVILFSLVGGVAADRWDRRRTLLWTQILLALCSGALALLTWSGGISLFAIYGVVVVSTIVDSIGNPTRQALIPALVPREELPAASTMSLIDFHLATIGGPALGGLLIAGLGVGSAYLVDALSFCAVIAAVLAMRARPALPPVTMGGLASALEGLRFLRGAPVLLGVMLTDFFATFFGFSASLMPIFADTVLHAGPRGYGLLLSAPAVGAVASAATLAVVRLPDRAGLTVLASIGLYGICMLGFGLSRALWLSLLCLVLAGATDSVSMTLRHGMRNLLAPDALRGRVASVHRMLGAGGPQLGEFEAGVLASAIGAGPAVAFGGAATIATAVVAGRLVPAIARFRLSRASLPGFAPEPARVDDARTIAGVDPISAD